MMLLRFRMRNHRSFRDPAELSLVESRLKTARPVDAPWSDVTLKVAGIYGANASGKSSVLDALEFMCDAIRYSAGRWMESPTLPQRPFKLDAHSASESSEYNLDFVIDDMRYEYGFTISPEAIFSEWLYDYPVNRRRLLFERTDGIKFRFGRALAGGAVSVEKFTDVRELFLSRAAASRHAVLRPIATSITENIRVAQFSDADRRARLQRITNDLATGVITFDDVVTLLGVADVGIGKVEVQTSEVPDHILRVLKKFVQNSSVDEKDSKFVKPMGGATSSEADLAQLVEQVSRNLSFRHLGERGDYYALAIGDQSTGTLSWLSLAVPSVTALRNGGVLLVDELDASLHPQLAQVLIKMFKDPDYNRRGAQLIFTTHDVYFLSPSADVQLDPEEVWFVEKDRQGVSELYSLADFSTRADQNKARRYLDGRYGAVPSVAPSFLSDLLTETSDAPR